MSETVMRCPGCGCDERNCAHPFTPVGFDRCREGRATGFDNWPTRQNDDRRLAMAERRVQELEDMIAQVRSAPMQVGVIARSEHASSGRYYYSVSTVHGMQDFEVRGPKYKVGEHVWITTNSNAPGIAGRVPVSKVPAGLTGHVKVLLSENVAEVDLGTTGTRVVHYSLEMDGIKEGAKVICDRGGNVVVAVLENTSRSAFTFDGDTHVAWDDIVGLDEAKYKLREAVELASKHKELFSAYGKAPVRGVLLAGPPGVGKTMLAKATATALRAAYGADAKGGFFYLKGPQVVDKYVGVGEAKIRELFSAAREHWRKTHTPSVIFLDEADAILGERGDPVFTVIERKMVPQFLSEMDGLEETNSLVLIATNRPRALDPAITRHGRINRTIYVTRPTVDVSAGIIEKALERTETHVRKKGKTRDVAKRVAESLYLDRHIVGEYPHPLGPVTLRLRDLVNGALVVEVVEHAVSAAIKRDIEAKEKTPSGVLVEDLYTAVDLVVVEERQKNHTATIAEIVEERLRAKTV